MFWLRYFDSRRAILDACLIRYFSGWKLIFLSLFGFLKDATLGVVSTLSADGSKKIRAAKILADSGLCG